MIAPDAQPVVLTRAERDAMRGAAEARAHGQPTTMQVAHLGHVPSPDPRLDPTPKPMCTCDDPDVDRLRDLIAGGMSQFEASRMLWPLDVVAEVKEAITPKRRRKWRAA